MRELQASVGAMISFGGLALMSIGLPFLVVGCSLVSVGLFTLGFRGLWAITLGIGGVPMAVLLRNVVGTLASPDPPCTHEGSASSASLPASAGEGASVSCATPLSGGYVAVLVFFAAIAVSGVLWRVLVQRRF